MYFSFSFVCLFVLFLLTDNLKHLFAEIWRCIHIRLHVIFRWFLIVLYSVGPFTILARITIISVNRGKHMKQTEFEKNYIQFDEKTKPFNLALLCISILSTVLSFRARTCVCTVGTCMRESHAHKNCSSQIYVYMSKMNKGQEKTGANKIEKRMEREKATVKFWRRPISSKCLHLFHSFPSMQR